MIKNLQKSSTNPKATICRNKTCVTITGDTARFVNGAVTFIAVVAIVSAVVRALK